MILKNWYNMMKANRMTEVLSGGYTNISGTVFNAAYYNSATAIPGLAFRATSVVLTLGSPGIHLGSGTTTPTLEDYKLENMITSGLTCSLATTVDDDNDAIYTITATNSTDADIVVGEVGISATGYRTSGNTPVVVLIERTVLDKPITIPAGGIGVVTYAIKLNYPTA